MILYWPVNVAANARISRSTSASFDRNMKRFAPGSSTIRAVGTAARRSCCHRVYMARVAAYCWRSAARSCSLRISKLGGHFLERALRLVHRQHRHAYARIIRLHPRIHGDRPANLGRHQRSAHRTVGIRGELLTPFSFGKGDPLIASLRERFERAVVGRGAGLIGRGSVVGSGIGGSYAGVVGSLAPSR